jgi:hypothetical protein
MIQTPLIKKPGTDTALPRWIVASVLGAVLLLFALVGWHLFGASSASSRPDLPVHPGMYNLRQELQKGMAAKQNANSSNEKRSAP